MPTVEKTTGGRVKIRDIGEFRAGDRAEVSTADAQYLVEERGDFEIAGDSGPADDDVHEEDGPPDPVTHTIEDTIDAGECPWCDDYEGDAVGQHAASAHPDEWDDYKED